MFLRSFFFGAAVLLAGVGITHANDDPAAAARTRKAVDRSLPFLETEGVAWMKEKSCASCHHVPFLLRSHNEARARGFTIDEKKLADWTGWTEAFSRSRRAWFTLTSESLDQLGGDGVPHDVLSRLQGLVGKPFRTETELLAELGRALTPEELNRHKAALVKRAARPPEPANDGGGLDTLSQLLLGRDRHDRGRERDGVPRGCARPDGALPAAGRFMESGRPVARATIGLLGTLPETKEPPGANPQ